MSGPIRARARSRAVAELIRRHAGEFDDIHNTERARVGLGPVDPTAVTPPVTADIDGDELRRLWDTSWTRDELAAHFAVHPRTISNHARRLGLRRKSGWHQARPRLSFDDLAGARSPAALTGEGRRGSAAAAPTFADAGQIDERTVAAIFLATAAALFVIFLGFAIGTALHSI